MIDADLGSDRAQCGQGLVPKNANPVGKKPHYRQAVTLPGWAHFPRRLLSPVPQPSPAGRAFLMQIKLAVRPKLPRANGVSYALCTLVH